MNPYSSHTFLYPFIITEKWTPNEEYWERDWLSFSAGERVVLSGKNENERKLNYATYQYFNQSARSALFDDSNIVDCYKSKIIKENPDNSRDKSKYIISLPDKTIALNLNGVRLKLYPDIEIGVLVFETEYYPEDGLSDEEKRSNVMLINEYGRRVYPPFLPGADKFMLCPESICITDCFFGELKKDVKDDFRRLADPSNKSENSFINNPGLDPEIIRRILFGLDKCVEIEPAIDDRMFVCCVISDEKWTKELISATQSEPLINNEGEPELSVEEIAEKYKQHAEKKKELYTLLNVDSSVGNCSCQNTQMLEMYIQFQTYKRWTDWGTMHGVTNYSLFCLTGKYEYVESSVINPFLTEYVQMCILTLVQRAALIHFDFKINNAIEHSDSVGGLMKNFAKFQGQIMLPEATSQIQGIEIYKKLTEALYIKELEEDINKQIHNLFEITENENSEKQQKSDNRFTVLGAGIGFLAIFSAFTDFYEWLKILFLENEEPERTIRFERLSELLKADLPLKAAGIILLLLCIVFVTYFICGKIKSSGKKKMENRK